MYMYAFGHNGLLGLQPPQHPSCCQKTIYLNAQCCQKTLLPRSEIHLYICMQIFILPHFCFFFFFALFCLCVLLLLLCIYISIYKNFLPLHVICNYVRNASAQQMAKANNENLSKTNSLIHTYMCTYVSIYMYSCKDFQQSHVVSFK